MDREHPNYQTLSRTHKVLGITDYNDRTYIAGGWHIVKSKKWYNVLTHSGMSSGHHAYISIVPETRTGVIILANSVIGTEDLSFLILKMINHSWKRRA
jgi:hypothetical protein